MSKELRNLLKVLEAQVEQCYLGAQYFSARDCESMSKVMREKMSALSEVINMINDPEYLKSNARLVGVELE